MCCKCCLHVLVIVALIDLAIRPVEPGPRSAMSWLWSENVWKQDRQKTKKKQDGWWSSKSLKPYCDSEVSQENHRKLRLCEVNPHLLTHQKCHPIACPSHACCWTPILPHTSSTAPKSPLGVGNIIRCNTVISWIERGKNPSKLLASDHLLGCHGDWNPSCFRNNWVYPMVTIGKWWWTCVSSQLYSHLAGKMLINHDKPLEVAGIRGYPPFWQPSLAIPKWLCRSNTEPGVRLVGV